MDDLISRAAALYAIDGLLSGNPKQEAMDAICDLEADSPLGAVAMREACATVTEWTAWGERHNLTEATRRAIRALPTPDHAALLAAALKLPEVAAMVEAANAVLMHLPDDPDTVWRTLEDALAALEGKP